MPNIDESIKFRAFGVTLGTEHASFDFFKILETQFPQFSTEIAALDALLDSHITAPITLFDSNGIHIVVNPAPVS